MAKFVVIYENMQEDAVTEDQIPNVLKAHVDFLKDLHSKGILSACGPIKDNNDEKGMLIFEAKSREEVEGYVLKDPFIALKCYAIYRIYEWTEANDSNNWLI